MTHPVWHISEKHTITLDEVRLMGILNVTPDSFSDGGMYSDVGAAVNAALCMIDEGADIIDIGGESTRPGASRIDAGEQLRRVVPVIEQLRKKTDVPISIDTTLSTVARAALNAGANIINDVSAGLDDCQMIDLAAERKCGMILMHRLRKPGEDTFSTLYTSDTVPLYDNVVEEVSRFLAERTEAGIQVGVNPDSIIVDPGLGFGKSVEQNYTLIARIDEISRITGHPVLFAASRKSFLAMRGADTPPGERLPASIAVAVAAYLRGIRLFRVHDVAAHRDALDAAAKIDIAALHNSPAIG